MGDDILRRPLYWFEMSDMYNAKKCHMFSWLSQMINDKNTLVLHEQ